MICTQCFSHKTRVLETRAKRFVTSRRERCLDCGAGFKTVEVPYEIIAHFGRKQFAERVEIFETGVSKRLAMRLRNQRIYDMVDAGWTSKSAIADEVGITETRVRQILKARPAQVLIPAHPNSIRGRLTSKADRPLLLEMIADASKP